jgi:type II secretory pathway component PulF
VSNPAVISRQFGVVVACIAFASVACHAFALFGRGVFVVSLESAFLSSECYGTTYESIYFTFTGFVSSAWWPSVGICQFAVFLFAMTYVHVFVRRSDRFTLRFANIKVRIPVVFALIRYSHVYVFRRRFAFTDAG